MMLGDKLHKKKKKNESTRFILALKININFQRKKKLSKKLPSSIFNQIKRICAPD
jgi:hypothetical protein